MESKMPIRRAVPPAPYEVNEEDIAALYETSFVDTMNHLIRAEGDKLGMAQTDIETTLRMNEPDGGVDARVRNAPAGSKWIPEGISVWQFKVSATNADVRAELAKAGVQEIIARGGAYCFVIGEHLGPIAAKNRKSALHKCFVDQRANDTGQLLVASGVAEWACNYPAVVFLPHCQ